MDASFAPSVDLCSREMHCITLMDLVLSECLKQATQGDQLYACLQESLIPKAFCNEGSASPHTPQSTIAAGGQQHSASIDIASTELAQTELATSVSSRSSASLCSGYR